MITSKVPEDWMQLQAEVGRLLQECGFTVEIEKKTTTVRGDVELDVYAQEEIKGRKYSIVCECKHWKARVPQNVVHGFRTVVADIGANIGYIVSIAGFQDGAFRASELTNVELVTWEGLQSKFEVSWYENYLSPQIAERLDALNLELREKHFELGAVVMAFTPYVRMLRKDVPMPSLPLIDHLPPNIALRENAPESLLRQSTYREFFDELVDFGSGVTEQFRELRHAAVGDD
jgi:restriction system protein